MEELKLWIVNNILVGADTAENAYKAYLYGWVWNNEED